MHGGLSGTGLTDYPPVSIHQPLDPYLALPRSVRIFHNIPPLTPSLFLILSHHNHISPQHNNTQSSPTSNLPLITLFFAPLEWKVYWKLLRRTCGNVGIGLGRVRMVKVRDWVIIVTHLHKLPHPLHSSLQSINTQPIIHYHPDTTLFSPKT